MHFRRALENQETHVDRADSTKCEKCGFLNASGLKFCGNCGSKLAPVMVSRMVQALGLLFISTSLYLVISIIFNGVVQSSPLFLVGYLVSILLGMFVGYGIVRGERGGLFVIGAAASIAVGLGSSFLLFLVGLSAQGVIGPVWIFFVVMAWVLWKARKEL